MIQRKVPPSKFLTRLAIVCCVVMVVVYKNYLVGIAWFSPIAGINELESDYKANPERINEYDSDGLTGLMVAVKLGDVPRVQFLLERKAAVNLTAPNDKDRDNNTALHFAVYFGDNGTIQEPIGEKIIYLLLKHGANTRARNGSMYTPLMYVLQITNLQTRMRVLKALLAYGAEFNAQADDGNTMVHLAAAANDYQWIDMLAQELRPRLDLSIVNKEGLTPEGLANKTGLDHMQIVLARIEGRFPLKSVD
jgi:ankyrin repeat protein